MNKDIKMIKKIIWLPIIALSLLFSQASFSHNEHAGHKHVCMKNAYQELNLSADQKSKISSIKAQARENMKGKWQEMHAIHQQMREVVRTNKLDHSKVDSLISRKKELVGSMMKTKLETRHQIYNVLDEKQKGKFDSLTKKCEMQHMNKKHNMQHMNKNASANTTNNGAAAQQ
jgi:protein CpxP